METNNYWQRRRFGRRTVLRAGGIGMAGIAGAALIGCGEDEAEPTAAPPAGSTTAPSGGGTSAATAAPTPEGIFASREVRDADAVRGGIFMGSTTADVTNVDPLASESFTANTVGRWTYPQLLQFKPGVGGPPPTGEVEPQLAESYEFQDETTLILHLRQDAKWEERAPTNSRGVVADDVVFSWNKFKTSSISRDALANEVNPIAPIIDMSAIDDYTVQVDLAFPFAPLLGSLAYTRWLQIEPMEADGGYDPRNETRGAGPWILQNYERSVKYEYRRNPNYWNAAERPFMDGFDVPIITEYAQQLAQFRAGRVWAGVVNQQDILDTKAEIPELAVLQGAFTRGNWQIYFGLKPDSPFRDERVRQAVSMAIDRSQINQTFYSTNEFVEAGWPVEERWHSVGVSAGYDGFWIDPKGDEYSEEAKAVYAYNPGEAKKLVDAAVGGSINTKMHWISTGQYGTAFPRVGEAYKGLLEATGAFTLEQSNPDYQTDYLPNIYFGKGNFDGIAWGASTIFPHVAQHLQSYFHSQGGRQKVAFSPERDTPADPASVEGTAASDALIERAMASLDFEEQVELVRQWQLENSTRMPFVPSGWPYGVAGFGLHWPWIGNYGAYRGYLEQDEQTEYIHWWIDEAKMNEVMG